MLKAHASGDVLASYADGSLSEGMDLLVASHLTYCAVCRDRVSRLEELGGAVLAMADPVEPENQCLDEVLSCLDQHRMDALQDIPQSAPTDGSDVSVRFPAPLRDRILGGGKGIRWRFLMPGLSEYRIDGFQDEEVSILRARPGVRIPSHTHSGEEATLILSGAMRDGDAILERGDVAFADQNDDHRPEIVGSETCFCLTVVTGKLRFTGPFGRALNFLNN